MCARKLADSRLSQVRYDEFASVTVNTFISRGIWGAWLLVGALISASLDSVPDFPAVLKHARASQFQLRSHSDPASRAHHTVPASVVPALPTALPWQSFAPPVEGAPLRGNLRFAIWRASDSSPPLYHI
jgi:hypothetical protein